MHIDLLYLPNIQYFSEIKNEASVELEVCCNYEKQTFRNRCTIITSQKVENLVIPIVNRPGKQIYKDVKIDYSQAWIRQHLGAITAAYGKAPFFEHYFIYLEKIINKKHDYLVDLNLELLSICLKFLKLNPNLNFTEKYIQTSENDHRNAINPKGSKNNLDKYAFKPYSQVFGQEFVSNLSVIDTIMCTGPIANCYL